MKRLFPLIIFVLLFLISCNPKKEQRSFLDLTKLSKSWRIEKAWRNSQLTTTLDGAYFNFKADSLLETNISGEIWTVPYTTRSGVIVHDSPVGKLTYVVDSIDDSILQIQTHIQGVAFKFFCVPGQIDTIPTARPLNPDNLDRSRGQEL